MQVSVESNGPLGNTLRVEVPEDRITGAVEHRLKSLSRTTRIQGFRPGKAPIKVIQQRFGSRVRDEVVGEIIKSSFFEAITREKLRPAGNPEFGNLDSDQGKGLTYTATFEVLPEFELADIAQLAITRPVCTISDADIDKMVGVLREQKSELHPVEREARTGDTVEIDYTGTIDGNEFPGGTGTGMKVELGARRLIDGFEDGLIGACGGEQRTLDLQFPDDYHNKEVAGKPVQFKIQLNSVQEPVLPELDESFFAGFGVREGGMDAFRQQVREHLERESEQAVSRRLRDGVMDALHEANRLELPETLVNQERQRMRHRFEHNLKAQGIATDKLPGDRDTDLFVEQARKQVALQLIVAELIRVNDLKPDPAKVRSIIEKNAESYQDPAAIINWYYADKHRLEDIESLALEQEVIDWVVEKARVTDQEMSFDECVNNRQTG